MEEENKKENIEDNPMEEDNELDWDEFGNAGFEDEISLELVCSAVYNLRDEMLNLKRYIKEKGDVNYLSKQIDRLDNIVDILENFWEI